MMANASESVSTNKSHNKILAQSVSSLDDIIKIVRQSETHLTNHRQTVRDALVAVYKLGQLLHKNDLVQIFYRKQGLDYSKKAETNLFHSLVSKAFEETNREDAKSKYRLILRYAFLKHFDARELEEKLEKSGIEDTYKTARTYLRTDFSHLYEENNKERYDRAKLKFRSSRIGSAITLGKNEEPPISFDGYANAIIRLSGRKIEVVAVPANQSSEDVETNLANLIDPEGSRVKAKLKDKPLYHLFTIADIFSRFVPAKSEVEKMEKAKEDQSIPDIKIDLKNIDHVKLLKDTEKYRNQPPIKFTRITVLVFDHSKGNWTAETYSTLPSFPVVEFDFGEHGKRVSKRPPLCLFDKTAENFAQWFLEPADWSVKRINQGFGFQTPLGRNIEILPWPAKRHNWRTIKKFDSNKLSFDVSRYDIREILEWKKNRPATFGRTPSFPDFLNTSADQKQIFLHIGRDRQDRKLLGTLDAPTPTADPIGVLTVDVKHINRIAQLAIDYELDLRGAVLFENGNPLALQFSPKNFWCPLKVTIPLTMSKFGAPTEICKSVSGGQSSAATAKQALK